MIIVSGFRRAGTSLMMHILKDNLGMDRLFATQFPQEEFEQDRFETDIMFELRKKDILENQVSRIKDLNKNGLWETPFTINGLRYYCQYKITHKNNPDLITKVVAEGLSKSSPYLFDRIIFMIRDPFDEVCSLSKIVHRTKIHPDIGTVFKLQNPEHLLRQILDASMFLNENKNIPLIFIDFYKLVKNPKHTLKVISDFLGEEIIDHSIIDEKMISERGDDSNTHLPIWQELFMVYDLFIKKKYNAVIDLLHQPYSELAKDLRRWYCKRKNRLVNHNICLSCKQSEKDLETCLFNQGYNIDEYN